mmetsp:Transcript_128103/g.246792  ORF Transcript_128103/g.246792 Transcript_128103/m.246792 type:complete len:93 (-) Transcript_128103:141-419(-)
MEPKITTRLNKVRTQSQKTAVVRIYTSTPVLQRHFRESLMNVRVTRTMRTIQTLQLARGARPKKKPTKIVATCLSADESSSNKQAREMWNQP